jgi:hypothetical protein
MTPQGRTSLKTPSRKNLTLAEQLAIRSKLVRESASPDVSADAQKIYESVKAIASQTADMGQEIVSVPLVGYVLGMSDIKRSKINCALINLLTADGFCYPLVVDNVLSFRFEE